MDQKAVARAKELIRRPLEWDCLIQASLSHGLMPLLYSNLKSHCSGVVPQDELDRLRNLFRQNSARNVLLTAELCSILEIFESQGIEAIPYKGPALACQVYGDLRLRSFIDLDILVRQSDIAKIRGLLTEKGYQPQLEMTVAKERAILRSECDEVFTLSGGKISLEVHWAITPPFFSFPLTAEDLFERSITIELLGRKVPAFAAEDLLLILCVNGTKDVWSRLEFICRVAELLRRYPKLDWKRTLEQASNLGAERMLLLGLHLAHYLLDMGLPEAVLQKLQQETILRRLTTQVCEILFVRPERSLSLSELTLFRLRSRERLRDRVSYCLKRAITPTHKDVDKLPLPPSLEFLYPLVRPFRLIRR